MAMLTNAGDAQDTAPDVVKVSAPVKYWCAEIEAARAREKDYRKEGKRVKEIYDGCKKDQTPFNILYSNTETLLPALYNAQPRPVVQRRFKDDDPIGKAASQVGQRSLEYFIDTNSEEYATYDDVMGDAVLDALLPGRGATRVKYDAEVPQVEGGDYAVASETVCYESLKWDRWIFGYSKKWKKVPWIAIDHDVTKAEATRLFGAEKANKLKYTAENGKEGDDDEKTNNTESYEQDQKTCRIHEIWDKAGGRKVRFVSEHYPEDYLKVDDDPLDLTGFYPIPEPLRFLRKANDLLPVAPYVLYENQAKELNRITVRINKIVEALKVRGAYDSTLGEIADLLKKEDNTLVPAENVAALQDGGLDKAIWLMPLEKLVTVLQQLYIARENCKRVIYEITGISDILRGASQASETLGAQEIKQQWATLRLKRLQKEVARYARDLLRLTLEIAAKHCQTKTIAQITGLPYPTKQEQDAAAGQLAIARATQQQPDPKAMQIMSTPNWDQVLASLRDDTQRQYRIDIETNSTVDLEATEDQKNLADMMNAIAQFMNGVAPLVESGAMDIEGAKGMLLYIVRKQRMGVEIEDYVKAMKKPESKDDGKAQAEQAKMQMAQQAQQHSAELEKQKQAAAQAQVQADQQLEILKFQFEQKMEEATALREHQSKMAELEATKVVELAKLSSQRATEEMKAKYAHQTAMDKANLEAATAIRIAEINAAAAERSAETSAEATVKTAGMKEESRGERKGDKSAEAGFKAILEGQGKILEALSAEKEAIRDGQGRISGIRTKAKA